MNPLEKMGEAIKEARLAADLTQKDLAKSLHITPRHLIALESGKQKPSYDLLCALVHKIVIPLDDIFFPERVHNRKELEEVVATLQYCDDHDIKLVSAVVHTIMKTK